MKRVLAAGLVVFLGVSLTTACSGSRQPAVQQTAALSNAELQERVREKLDSVPELKASRLLIDTDATQNQVVLYGTLQSEELHSQAVSLAQSAVPGITVTDRIDVVPSELARTDTTDQQKSGKSKTGKKSPDKRR